MKRDLQPTDRLPALAGARSTARDVGLPLDAFPHALHFRVLAAAELNALKFLAGFVEFTEGKPVFRGLDANGMFKAEAPAGLFWKIRARRHGAKIRCHTAGGFADQAFAYGQQRGDL